MARLTNGVQLANPACCTNRDVATTHATLRFETAVVVHENGGFVRATLLACPCSMARRRGVGSAEPGTELGQARRPRETRPAGRLRRRVIRRRRHLACASAANKGCAAAGTGGVQGAASEVGRSVGAGKRGCDRVPGTGEGGCS